MTQDGVAAEWWRWPQHGEKTGSSISSYRAVPENRVQPLPGKPSEQVGMLTDGWLEMKRASRTVCQESMVYKVEFTH